MMHRPRGGGRHGGAGASGVTDTGDERVAKASGDAEVIAIRGAREHNLVGVDVDLPKRRLVVITGVSGSGKSSLAFDTLFAEGQRRYVESLSSYARQFLGQMDKPRYDSIRGLSPTIAIEQKAAAANPRSTVGTVTEIYDYLRVLFARAGVVQCHACGREVGGQSAEQIADRVLGLPEGTRLSLLAPLVRQRKGSFRELLDEVRRDGFVRVRVDGEIRDLADGPALAKTRKHDIDVVVDRLVRRPDMRSRLVDSIETALRFGDGSLVVERADTGEDLHFSERQHCADCNLSFPELSPQLFSFNSPLGMCRACNGLGTAMEVDPDRVVPDAALSLDQGAIVPWANALGGEGSSWTGDIVAAVCEAHHIDRSTPWAELSEEQRHVLLYGAERRVEVRWERERGSGTHKMRFEGVANTLLRRLRETKSDDMRSLYQGFLRSTPCGDCGGSRLRPEARHVCVGSHTLPEVVAMPVDELATALGALELSGNAAVVAVELVKEVAARLRFLQNVGLAYLTLDRASASLSGGESQRIRLASQIGTELTGVTYVLDEPSIGLHPRDNSRLIETLERLRDAGNTVVVVEHDADMMRSADFIVDFGPGAGALGGRVVAAGTPEEVMAHPTSLTGAYLSGRASIAVPSSRRAPRGALRVVGARAHNLQGIDVVIPLGVFAVVTGVSGAGKSTLVDDILRPALMRRLHGSAVTPGAHDRIDGLEQIDKIIDIDQRPIGRTPRSNPATYTKLFDEIRDVFAQTREARMRGYSAGRFSFNVKGGRCETCSGAGVNKVEMHFLADVYVTCESCRGRRFNDATLRVRYRGRTIADVLAMTVAEALEVFAHHRRIHRILTTLDDVGLGYVALGQPSTTLSGGEAQRVKLSRELAKVQTGRTLYVLDEPSTGLHLADVERLLAVLRQLVAAGNTVLMVEHNVDIIKVADHVIDLGPEGGRSGGRVVAEGAPEEVARVEASQTGRYLRAALGL